MDRLIESFRKTGALHHAHFIIGGGEVVPRVLEFLTHDVGLSTQGNPDFRHIQVDTVTIDHAREFGHAQDVRDFSGGRKIFIIETDVITQEAQNALLKVFEEPTVGTHFFIISPQDMLLPTLRSRMYVVHTQISDESKIKEEAKSILNLNPAERLTLVKEITDGITDEEKTKQDAIGFLNEIEQELYDGGVEKNEQALRVTQSARASLYDRGAPVKMILEHVVLTI